ncbi:MAG TPA: hypothetical protein VD813_01845, partial [Pseudonocardia sp.]|nr:hypothetical protein [Pseudonocardia sp.]
SPGELAVCLVTAAAGAALAVLAGARAGLGTLPLVVVAVVAFDLFGGAAVNAAPAAKRRFHGPGRDLRHHLGFVAVHVQPFLLAAVVPGLGWGTAAAVYGLTLAGALVVLAAPRRLRRPVAFGAAVLGSAFGLAALAVPEPLAWLVPTLLVKLLPGHLLPGEEPPGT